VTDRRLAGAQLPRTVQWWRSVVKQGAPGSLPHPSMRRYFCVYLLLSICSN
jgi:hypothetical protein